MVSTAVKVLPNCETSKRMYVGVVIANRRRLWVRAMKRTLKMKKSGALMYFRSTALIFVSTGSNVTYDQNWYQR
jgi:hypothetical protein